MKRKLACLVAIILSISNSTIGVTSVSADSTGKMSVSSATGKVGDEVTITVTMDENPGIISWRYLLNYDSDALEITNYEVGDIFTNAVPGKVADKPNPFKVNWADGGASENYTDTGILAKITFKIKDSAEAGNYTIDLDGDSADYV